MEAKDRIIEKFHEIKNQWIQTQRSGHQCLGNTFEDLMGVVENNNRFADYYGIEFKTKRNSTRSMITLFSQAPENSDFSNSKLRELYGYTTDESGRKMLYSSIGVKGTFNAKSNHFFIIELFDDERKLKMRIKESKNSEQYEDFYQVWDYSIFSQAISDKIGHIAFLNGDERIDGNQHFVKYTGLYFITGFCYENIMRALRNNHLILDLRLGVHKSGPNIGQLHDHGSGFRITQRKLSLYANFESVD